MVLEHPLLLMLVVPGIVVSRGPRDGSGPVRSVAVVRDDLLAPLDGVEAVLALVLAVASSSVTLIRRVRPLAHVDLEGRRNDLVPGTIFTSPPDGTSLYLSPRSRPRRSHVVV